MKVVRSADGVALAYQDSGQTDGPAVVLCHGLGADGRQFAADAAFFAARGYRVLVPDVRGHGQSGAPAGRNAHDFTIPRLAADMTAILDHAGAERVHWVGNSLGGIVALELLARSPERLQSLATFGTAYALKLPPAAASAVPMLYAVLGRRLAAGITARMTTPDPGARALVGTMLRDFDQHSGRAVAENVRRYDLLANALGYRGPILLIRGGRDRLVNLALQETLHAMQPHPDFTRIDIPEAGHCANLDAPDQVRRALLALWERTGR